MSSRRGLIRCRLTMPVDFTPLELVTVARYQHWLLCLYAFETPDVDGVMVIRVGVN